MKIKFELYLLLDAKSVSIAEKVVLATDDLSKAVAAYNEHPSNHMLLKLSDFKIDNVFVCELCGRPIGNIKEGGE